MAVRDTLGPHVPVHPLTNLAAAQALLGHEFAQPALLAEALTHRSAAGAKGAGSNERLEFIGDRVLGLIVAEWLIERFPAEQEGALGRRLAALVAEPTLAEAAEALGLAALLTVSAGESKRGVRQLSTVLADALEAIIGALYLDAGIAPARAFIRRALGAQVEHQTAPPKDPKTGLQEWVLARGLPLPAYTLKETSGPSHAPHFVVEVSAGGQVALGAGSTKRAAEQAAARALSELLE